MTAHEVESTLKKEIRAFREEKNSKKRTITLQELSRANVGILKEMDTLHHLSKRYNLLAKAYKNNIQMYRFLERSSHES